jgi:hypothetical protein
MEESFQMNNNVDKSFPVNKKAIVAAAQKALIAADSQYFAWTPEQQEHFRANMNEEACTRAKQILLRSLLNIKCSFEQVDKVWKDVPIAQLYPLNWANLLISGIGEDTIYLNEFMSKGKSLLDFTTLYDYDYPDYLFQEEARHRDMADYKGTAYYAWRFPSWARLLIDDQFYYATLLSLATHFLDKVQSAGNKLIDQLIPHQYVEGKDDGKLVFNEGEEGFLWDKKLDANGSESQLDELRSRWYLYQQQCWLDLSEKFSQLPPAVYTLEKNEDDNWDDDPHLFFIFNNVNVLKQIRWRYFLSDCRPFMTDFAALNDQLTNETERATSWLTQNHQDIIKNFDPKLVKLRKKKQIIFSASALDDLNKM